MTDQNKKNLIKATLLAAMAGITITEVQSAAAQTLTPIAYQGPLNIAFVQDSGPSWVEFIRHSDFGNIINPGILINPGIFGL